MSERNALPLIKKALEEKTVEVALPEGGNSMKGHLIKISGDVDPRRDFRIMYEDIEVKVLKKIERRLHLENQELLKSHGVLIDPKTLKIIFTFNMAFADLHTEGKRFVRFPPAEIFPVVIQDYYGHPCRDGDPCFGRRAKRLVEKHAYLSQGKVANCLASFTDALSKHVVSVRLPGEAVFQDLYLIKIWAKTNLGVDCRISYPDSMLYAKLFAGSDGKEDFREYGLFIRPEDLAIVFAFNTAFAKYDFQSKTIEYWTIAENLLKDLRQWIAKSDQDATSGMRGVIMYALSEPRK